MEFDFELRDVFPPDKSGICIIKGEKVSKKNHKLISMVLDEVGASSAKVNSSIYK
jgi:hypothetical protein